MKFLELVKQYVWQVLTVIFLLLYVGEGCTSKKISKMNTNLSTKVDSLSNVINTHQITPEANKQMLEDMMWEFLEYEEMSDKNKIPINKLKSDHAAK